MRKELAVLAAASLLVTTATAQDLMGQSPEAQVVDVPVVQGRIDAISGVVYSQVFERGRSVRGLKMTLFVPRTKEKKPAVLYFPGGGFTSADHEKFLEMRYALACAGYVVAACEYRAVPNKFPALLEDAKAAVRWMRAHASEFGVDANRIGLLGDSAGGYVVQMAGATNGEKNWDVGDFKEVSSDVQAVVSIYGISDLTTIGEGIGNENVHASAAVTEALLLNGPAFKDFAGASVNADPQKAKAASPIGHVDGTEPPFLLMHGSGDKVVSPLQSKKMFEALQNKKVEAEYVLVRGAEHGDLPWYQPGEISRVVNFFDRHLKRTE
jgi:acetyl esterase/lipase